jgi:hypothetical protein
MNLLYRDDMTYIDSNMDLKQQLHVLQNRLNEAHWFIRELCNTATIHEKQILAMNEHLKVIWIELKEIRNVGTQGT